MNFQEYDRIQASLGGVGDAFRSAISGVVSASNAETGVKDLVSNVASITSKIIDEMALLLSQAMQASIDQ